MILISDAALFYTNLCLLTLVIIGICYASRLFYLKKQKQAQIAFPRKAMHNNHSRCREIAILAKNSKDLEVLNLVNNFVDTMREHGSYAYHFTHYWADARDPQRVVTELFQKQFHGIYVVGQNLTFLAKQVSLAQDKKIPIIFSNLLHASWEEEQEKLPVTHLTGVSTGNDWRYRIKIFLALKPSMRAVLLPTFSSGHLPSVQKAATILQNYGVTTYVMRVHTEDELLNTLQDYADKIDSVIRVRDLISVETSAAIARTCSEYGITFFSSFVHDVQYGAAIAMSTVNQPFGQLAAEKMIAVLEEHKSPIDIPVTNISGQYPYEVHCNQLAMKAQGIDPSRIIVVGLQHAVEVAAVVSSDSPNHHGA